MGVATFFGFVLLACSMSGCITDSGMPSIRGRTTYTVEFRNVTEGSPEVVNEDGSYTEASPGEVTEYSCTIKAPAGVELADIAGFSIATEAGGAYQMGVNQQPSLSSQGQADMIPGVVGANAQLAGQMTASITGLLGQIAEIAAPIALANIAADAATAQRQAELKAQRQAALMETVRGIVGGFTPTPPE